MPSNDYAVYVKNPTGSTLAVLDRFSIIDLTLIQNSVGNLVVTLPYGAYNQMLFGFETVLEVWRSINGAPPYLVGNKIWLVNWIDRQVTATGGKYLILHAADCNIILARRLIAHAQQAAQTHLSGACDDLCKTVVKNEMGSGVTDFIGANTARDLSAYLTVDANLTLGPSTTHDVSQRDVLGALQDIANISAVAPGNNVSLYFDVRSTVPVSGLALNFATYTGQMGNDHRFPTSINPVILTSESGSLSQIIAADDYTGVRNAVYAAGQGTQGNRVYQSTTDATTANTIGAGPFARSEDLAQALNAATAAYVLVVAQQGIRTNRARRTIIANYTDTKGIVFGQHFNYGDYVTTWFDSALDTRVEGVNLHVEAGLEQINLGLRTNN